MINNALKYANKVIFLLCITITNRYRFNPSVDIPFLSWIFLLAIVLSVLLFTASDYLLGLIKLCSQKDSEKSTNWNWSCHKNIVYKSCKTNISPKHLKEKQTKKQFKRETKQTIINMNIHEKLEMSKDPIKNQGRTLVLRKGMRFLLHMIWHVIDVLLTSWYRLLSLYLDYTCNLFLSSKAKYYRNKGSYKWTRS